LNELRFDELLRLFASGFSRRATLAALASGVFGVGLDDADARKKHRHKKKKRNKCKGDTKKCGKKCISSSGCCSSSDCGANGTCVGNTCSCNSGFKECNGACIPQSDCCGTCPGDTVCDNGECVCPEDAPFACPGDVCFSEGQCCVTEECSGVKECVEGLCLCPGADAINCHEVCCDGDTEVCKLEKVGNDFVTSCQDGSCPATNFCVDRETEQFVCALDLDRVCVCTLTTDLIPGKVCVDLNLLVDNNPCDKCDTSSDCGSGQVCITGGDGCVCGGSNFCVPLCPEATFTRAKRGAGGTPGDLEALMGSLRKRHR
jgi:hypothetical protein